MFTLGLSVVRDPFKSLEKQGISLLCELLLGLLSRHPLQWVTVVIKSYFWKKNPLQCFSLLNPLKKGLLSSETINTTNSENKQNIDAHTSATLLPRLQSLSRMPNVVSPPSSASSWMPPWSFVFCLGGPSSSQTSGGSRIAHTREASHSFISCRSDHKPHGDALLLSLQWGSHVWLSS